MTTEVSDRERRSPSPGNGRAPEKPTALRTGSWRGVLKRTVSEFRADNVTDWAAALTYYGVLAIFPAIVALVSILGLIGPSATQPLITNVGKLAPGSVHQILVSAIQNLQHSRGAAGILFVVGIAGAVWSASGYIAAFMRASNAIYDIDEGRPIWMTLPVRIGVTLVLLVLLAISAIAVALTGGLAQQVGKLLGTGDTAVTVWDIAKWPVLLLIVSFMFSILYWAAPNVKHPGFRWLSPGGAVRGCGLGDRFGGVRVLRRELLLLQQDLRRARRGDHLPGVAVDLEHRGPAGSGIQCRDRARPADRGRPPW